MMQQERQETTPWHFAPTGQPRRSASTEPAEKLGRSQKSPKLKTSYLQRLTPRFQPTSHAPLRGSCAAAELLVMPHAAPWMSHAMPTMIIPMPQS
ncbi:MAG: hypothetical protein DDT34_02066 [Firmicutes bacterium]|nr:hypothetical protein [Bacillota bacterium]